MRIAIFGARGYIGRHLTDFCLRKGLDVLPFTSQRGDNIDCETGILANSFKLPEGIQTVVYLAQSPFYHQIPEKFSHVINVNVSSALALAELGRRNKVRRFIYASTGNVYRPSFRPLSETAALRKVDGYIMSKIWAEEALSTYRNDFEVIIFRPFGVYGPGQKGKLLPNLLENVLGRKITYIERNPHDPMDFDGLKISFCYIKDAVKAIYHLVVLGGPPFINIAGHRAVSIREVVAIIGESLRMESQVKLVDKFRDFDLIADISLLKESLNLEFTELEEGMKETVDFLLD
jgi:UDP-glucose 4-epimerase